ncbi:hypothetical protein ACFQXA_12540 [Nocardiopsis composta]
MHRLHILPGRSPAEARIRSAVNAAPAPESPSDTRRPSRSARRRTPPSAAVTSCV